MLLELLLCVCVCVFRSLFSVDLVQENIAINQHEAIQKFIQGTVADGAPVIPISIQLKYNIDVVAEYIVKKVPIPERNFISPPNMIVIQSFDVNKPGFEVDDIKGGVAGGSILKGVLKVNQCIEVRPGLVGVGTTMDPTLTRADRLVGQVPNVKREYVGGLEDVKKSISVQVRHFAIMLILHSWKRTNLRQHLLQKGATGLLDERRASLRICVVAALSRKKKGLALSRSTNFSCA
ncbi:hypothetical protein ACH5RR_021547 [Cinchona calisaya]|uniref:Uncharacterized protein n=1 Tax=Cinchona calisaya TaxID=153742 RepID=A0ABD2ZMK5_9GENT